jgi:hypothetical protein
MMGLLRCSMRRTFRMLEILLERFPTVEEIDHDLEKILVPSEFVGLDAQQRVVRRKPLHPTKRRPFLSMFRTPLAAFIRFVVTGSEALAETQRMSRDAARRYPHINFDA